MWSGFAAAARSVPLLLMASALMSVEAPTPPASTPPDQSRGAPDPWAGKSVTTPLYSVRDGRKVDPATLEGWRTWRAMACERCHGAEQEGLVGPALVESLKVLTKEDFKTTLINGRPEKGMPNFGGVNMVRENLDNLYAYLKGRSEGNIAPGHLYPMDADRKK